VIVALSVVTSFNAGGRVDASDSMTCGSGVELCGLLTLESGFGSGNYDHDECVVHGLWPEVSPYGTSECIAPSSSSADPEVVYSCYNQVRGRSVTTDRSLAPASTVHVATALNTPGTGPLINLSHAFFAA